MFWSFVGASSTVTKGGLYQVDPITENPIRAFVVSSSWIASLSDVRVLDARMVRWPSCLRLPLVYSS